MSDARPIRLLIAALGGEGGGVLASWITNAAVAAGHVAQRTSIPGVAQRTGATTYYLEVLPRDAAGSGAPVLALNPAPGEVDVMISSELLETVRAVQTGNITPDRTHLIASTHRVFTVDEKSAMADGRVDPEKMQDVARRFSKSALLADLAQTARLANSQLNAVMLGALAGSNIFSISDHDFRNAIRAEGKAVDANLRGFEAGFALATAKAEPAAVKPAAPALHADSELEAHAIAMLPREAAELAVEGIRRLTDFQNEGYAELYLHRLERFAKHANADTAFLRELARLLAVRMSFEDTIRVAQLKLREGRIERLRRESGAGDEALIRVSEFMKPGPEEIFSMLPPKLARSTLSFIERRGWSDRSIKMKVSTTSFSGFIRLRLLAGLRWWRPNTLRYAEETAWTERWLYLCERALSRDTEAAKAVVETAKLVKGYGETMKRGLANWNMLAEHVIEPFLAGAFPQRQFADAVTQGRLAALADPEGKPLFALVEAIRALPRQTQIAAE